MGESVVIVKNMGSLGESDAEKGGLNSPTYASHLKWECPPPPGSCTTKVWVEYFGTTMLATRFNFAFGEVEIDNIVTGPSSLLPVHIPCWEHYLNLVIKK